MALHLFDKKPSLSETERHLKMQAAIRHLVGAIKNIPSEELLAHVERLDRAESLGPVVDPQGWLTSKNVLLLERFTCLKVKALIEELVSEAARLNSPEVLS